jgi:hypothetical protein
LVNAWLRAVPLSTVKDTLPPGVPAVELTVTVIVALAGYITVGAPINIVVEAEFTTCERTVEVLVAKFVSPA